jgi:plastocyanin
MRRLVLAGALAMLVVPFAPARAGGGCHGAPAANALRTAPSRVNVAQCAYTPSVIRINPGATVTWRNLDQVPHTVTDKGGAFNGVMGLGESFSYRFERAGTFAYICAYHPFMTGTVVVGNGVAPIDSNRSIAASPVSARGSGGDAASGFPPMLAALLGAVGGGTSVAVAARLRRRAES